MKFQGLASVSSRTYSSQSSRTAASLASSDQILVDSLEDNTSQYMEQLLEQVVPRWEDMLSKLDQVCMLNIMLSKLDQVCDMLNIMLSKLDQVCDMLNIMLNILDQVCIIDNKIDQGPLSKNIVKVHLILRFSLSLKSIL